MTEHVYKMVELVGSSTMGSDDAVRNAVETAARTLRHVDWFQVEETRGHVVDGRIRHWQVRIKLGFRLEGADDETAVGGDAVQSVIAAAAGSVDETQAASSAGS